MNPNSILGRYLTKQLIYNFLFVLLMVLGVVFMFEMIEILRKASGRDDVGIGFLLQLGFTKLPKTIEMVFPFVMMIAAMITFWKLSKLNEFVIIRAAGVSIWGFLTAVLLATFLVGVINITIINPISANMFSYHQELDYKFDTRNPDAVLFSEKGLWIREAINEENVLVLQAKSARQENEKLFLRDVTIIEMDRHSQQDKRIEAYVAELGDGYFDLKDVHIFVPGMETENLSSMRYKTSLTIDRIKESFVKPEAISFWSLPDTISFYEHSGFSAQKHKLRYMTLLVSPFLLCAMVLVAAVFALRPNNRRGGVMFLIVGGITTGFLVYFLSQLVYALGSNGQIPLPLVVFTPTAVVALISISVLLHLEDG